RKAIGCARAERAPNPDDPAVHSYLALCLAKTGSAAEAREHVRRSLESEPERAELLFNAAVVATRAGRPEEAVRYVGRAVGAGFSPAIVRNEPELANLRTREDFGKAVTETPKESSR